jgi:GAF domain-containing protein/nitrogen-specific signal transduction histidine kinase
MDRPELLYLFSPRAARRLAESRLAVPQHVLALVLWLAMAVLAYWLNRDGSWRADLVDLLYFVVLHTLSVGLSVRLPMGLYMGLGVLSLGGTGLMLGPERALLVGLVGGMVGGLPRLLLQMRGGRPLRSRLMLVIELMFYSAALMTGMLPAVWAFNQPGGSMSVALSVLAQPLPLVAFGVVYFALLVALASLWLWLGGIPLGDYWRYYFVLFFISNCLPLAFVPLLATAYINWPYIRLIALLPYTVGVVLYFAFNTTHLGLNARLAELSVLNAIGQALNAKLDMDDLATTIYTEISKLADVSGFYLALCDERSNLISFPISYNRGQLDHLSPRPFANGLTEYILRTGKPLLLNRDAVGLARKMGLEPVVSETYKWISYLGVPIIVEGKAIGVLALRDYGEGHHYTEDDLRLLETIAAQTGVALQNARLFERIRRQANELSSLNQISALIGASLDLDTVIQTVCQVVVDTMHCQKSAVFLLDESGSCLRLAGSVGLSENYVKLSTAIDLTRSPRSEAIRTGKPVILEDILADSRFKSVHNQLAAEEVRGVLDMPLRSAERVIGVITAYYSQPHHFQASEVELMDTLGGQVAIAVENARLFGKTAARQRELEALYESSAAVNASLSLPNVLKAVTLSMIKALQIETCTALLLREDGQTLRGEVRMRVTPEGLIEERQVPIATLGKLSTIAQALARHEALVLRQADSSLSPDEITLLETCSLRSGVALPLVARDEPVGLILAGMSSQEHTFEPEQVHLAWALANQASSAIDNARLFERVDIALSRRLDEIAALELIAQRMTRRLDLYAVIEQVVAAAAAATGADYSEVALLDEQTGRLKAVAGQGVGWRPGEEWGQDEGLTGRALRTGQPVLVDDVSEDVDYVALREGIRSEMVVPIVLDGTRLGVINLESMYLSAFNVDHLRFVTNLAGHAAIAIQNARLFETVQRRAEEFKTLQDIAVELLSAGDLERTLNVIARGVLERSGAHNIRIYLYDRAADRLTFGASLWESGEVGMEVVAPRSAGITMTVAHTGERLVITDPRNHPLTASQMDHPAWRSYEAFVGVPLKHAGEVVGVFNVAFTDRTKVTEEVLHFLDLLGTQAAVAIMDARLAEQTRMGRDRLQAILDSSYDGLMMVDNEGHLVLANPRVEYLYNLRIGDLIGESYAHIMEQAAVAAGGDENFLAGAADVLESMVENPALITRRRYILSKPVLHVVEEISTAVLGQSGECLGRLFVLHDVTQEYQMEQYQREMSHMIVHDLRSPLGGVITGMSMALDEAVNLPPSPAQEMIQTTLSVALTSANSLLKLIETILDVNRLEAGEIPLVLRPYDLKILADAARQTFKNVAAEANITMEIRAPDDLPLIVVDGDKMQRVFQNLLDNALRYTPRGGHVCISIQPDEAFYTVLVEDNGDGIPPADRQRIFDRFVQADPSRRKRGPKGTGLGLYFCRLVVEAHGGRIWVSDSSLGGAALCFTLPTALQPTPEGAE